MPNRAKDWLAQAEWDLSTAEENARNGRHDWACFAAQQAAEKAVKAINAWHGQAVRGHVIWMLLGELPDPRAAALVGKAKVLDNFYIPTRDPNLHSEGAPFTHYGTIQSEQGYAFAREIVEFARVQMAGPRPG